MAVEAVASIVIEKLTVLIDKSLIVDKVIDHVREQIRIAIQRRMMQDDDTNKKYLRILYETEDVIETYALARHQRRRSSLWPVGGLFNHLRSHRSFHRKMLRIGKQIKQLNNENCQAAAAGSSNHAISRVGNEVRPGTIQRFNSIPSFEKCLTPRGQPRLMFNLSFEEEGQSSIVGFEEQVNSLVNQLQKKAGKGSDDDHDPVILSIIGEEGSGKTTLARAIYKNRGIKDFFKCRAWVSVSKGYTLKDVLLNILKETGTLKDKDVDLTANQLLESMPKALKNMKCLIVLDDVQAGDVWEELKGAFADIRNGTKIIITTSEEDLPLPANPQNIPQKVSPLSDLDGWKMFLKKARLTESSNISNDLKQKVLTKCRGLPLNIVLLGGLLSTKNKTDEWLRVLNSNRDILSLSYNDLPVYSKLCLLYLAFFPKEFDIPVRRLLRLWLAEGFVPKMIPEDVVQQSPTMIPNNVLQELPKMIPEDVVQQSPTMIPNDVVHESPKMIPEDVVQESPTIPDDVVKESPKMILEDVVQESPTMIPADVVHESPKMISEDVVQESLTMIPEAVVQESPKMIPEDVVQECFENLVKRSMIQISKMRSDGSPRRCNLLGSLHDNLLSKAQAISLFHIHHNYNSGVPPADRPSSVRRIIEYSDIKNCNPAADFPSVRRIIEYSDIKTCKTSQLQNLRSYLSFNNQKKDTPATEVGKFVTKIISNKCFGLLRVLDLEGVYKPSLPENLGDLFNLRYLGLRWTFLDHLPPSVGTLPYLETLDVKHTNINSLPKSIWKLKHLRHLNLNEIRLDMPPEQGLLTLWGLLIDDKSPVKNGLNKLLKLRELGITFHLSSGKEDIADWVANLTSLQSLRLRSKDERGYPLELNLKPLTGLVKLSHLYLLGNLRKLPDISHFPPVVKVLTLSVSRLNVDPMPILGKLPELTVLRLLADSYLGKTITCSGFSKLRVLKLWRLKKLEKWDVEEGAMRSLKELNIRCCDKLENIPQTLMQSTTLEDLILTNMPVKFKDDVRQKKLTRTSLTVNNWDFPPLPWEQESDESINDPTPSRDVDAALADCSI
ncbi:disease resistance RPP8-like protein 3 [Cornus florida]|uniref:disease resistance RPP8-like protein 3 n=1 Tax=Cornus florida TaxID=4283 RepID=UPI00289E856E|nr:disease resistance RPP8-like protein 3 [Cornus florida]